MYKFGPNDVFYNTIKSHPKYVIKQYWNTSFINNRITEGVNVQSGSISLYEINVDRPGSMRVKGALYKGDNTTDLIFKRVVTSSAQNASFGQGDETYLKYPLTASVQRSLLKAELDETIDSGGNPIGIYSSSATAGIDEQAPFVNKTVQKLIALGNSYDNYRTLSPFYDFNKYVMASGGIPHAQLLPQGPGKSDLVVPNDPNYSDDRYIRNTSSIMKNEYISLLEVPAIFYGSGIKKGSVDLKFYYTGALLARGQDINQNGQLIETTVATKGHTIGMVMYDEGAIIITASYNLDKHNLLLDGYLSPTGTAQVANVNWIDVPRWVYFGAYKSAITGTSYYKPESTSSIYAPASSSYHMEFKGTTYTPVLTMLANAPKNELNWSNNPTYIEHKETFVSKSFAEVFVKQTGSQMYIEIDQIAIKNTVSSSYTGQKEPFKPQTFISKIAIYDEDKNMIAVAKLANPILKKNEQDYAVKLKLDL
mgnify:CR=1 FL=1